MNPHAELDPRWILLAPLAAVLLLYLPSLGYGFVWDDINYIAGSVDLQHGDLWTVIMRPFLGQDYFRPLALLGLALEQRLLPGPALPHAVNLLLHALNTLLIGALTWKLAWEGAPERKHVAACAASLIYAMHPALVEPVCWISGRFDLLVTFFALTALLADRSISSVLPRALAVAGLFLMAALSKEMAAGLALMLPLWHWMLLPNDPAQRSKAMRQNWLVLAAVFCAGLLYLALRKSGLGELAASDQGAGLDLNRFLQALGGYWSLMLWPFGLVSPLHETATSSSLLRMLPLIGALGSLLAAVLLLRAAAQGKSGAARFDALPLCALLMFLPAANLLPLATQLHYVNDRFLTLPLSMMALWLGLRLPLRHFVPVAVVVTWILACFLCILSARTLWRSNLDLWTGLFRSHPKSDLVLDNTQQVLYANNYFEDSKRLFEFSVSQGMTPGPMRRSMYASSLEQLGEGAEALRQIDLAVAEQVPLVARPHLETNAGWIYLSEGHLQQARTHLERALQLQPGNPDASYFLAVALAAMDCPGADAYMERGLANTPAELQAPRRDSFATSVGLTRKAAASRDKPPCDAAASSPTLDR